MRGRWTSCTCRWHALRGHSITNVLFWPGMQKLGSPHEETSDISDTCNMRDTSFKKMEGGRYTQNVKS